MDSLKIDLFEPGMTALHRAGLGGLACTLDKIDRARKPDGRPAGGWTIDDRTVTLRWDGGTQGAGAFLKSLYAFAFQVDGGLIDLPGSYGPIRPRPEVSAELQRGLSATILQFGPNRKVASKTLKVVTYDVGEEQPVTIQHQDLVAYTHQSAWTDLVDSRGSLRPFATIPGTIAPGFAQRHVVHPSTVIEQPTGLALALHFALVGTISLAIDRSEGVMIVPTIEDLKDFIRRRQLLNPGHAQGCQINGAADAALQAEIRLRSIDAGGAARVEHCQAVRFGTVAWNPNQKSRTGVLDVAASERDLTLFQKAMQIPEISPRIALAKPEKKGEPSRPFWVKGVVRPLIAENLAQGRPWYQDFRRLIVSADGRTDEERVRLLNFEAKGLAAMIEKTPWQDRGEGALVVSIQEAMKSRFAAIGDDTDDPVTFGNRVDRQRQRWRLKFAGAKTPSELREALADLWSRSGNNRSLQSSWQQVLPWFCDESKWRLARDLCLLAMASYQPAKSKEAPADPSQTVPPTEDDR